MFSMFAGVTEGPEHTRTNVCYKADLKFKTTLTCMWFALQLPQRHTDSVCRLMHHFKRNWHYCSSSSWWWLWFWEATPQPPVWEVQSPGVWLSEE